MTVSAPGLPYLLMTELDGALHKCLDDSLSPVEILDWINRIRSILEFAGWLGHQFEPKRASGGSEATVNIRATGFGFGHAMSVEVGEEPVDPRQVFGWNPNA
jgi:hypothetical protein